MPQLPEIIARNQAVSAAARVHDWPKAFSILQKASQEFLQLTLVSFNSQLYAAGKETLDGWHRALSILNGMRHLEVEADVISYNSSIDSLQSTGPWEMSLVLLLHNLEANEISRNSALSVLEKSGCWQEALCLAFCQDSSIGFNALISSCEKATRWPMALGTLLTMQMRRMADEISVSSVLTAFQKVTTWKRLGYLLQELQDEIISADVILYNTAIAAAEKMSNWQVAVAFLQRMEVDSLKMDSISLNAAISACEKAAEWQVALELYDRLYQTHLQATVVTFAAITSALEKAVSAWPLALSLFTAGAELRSSVASSACLSACGKGRQWQTAMWILKDVKEQVLLVNAVCFNSALTACDFAAQWRWSVCLLDELHLQQLECQLIGANSVFSALSRGQIWWMAVELLKRQKAVDVLSLKEVLEAFGDRPADTIPWLLDALAVQSLTETRAIDK